MTQQARRLEQVITKTVRLPYLLFLPQGYGTDPDQRWPLILFLHGSGQRGDDLEILKRHGIPRIVEGDPRFPFIAVSPQCRAQWDWSMEMDALDTLLQAIVAGYAVDERRIYLTGLSMGGRAAWHLATLFPQRFAALAPVCGRRPDLLRNTPNMAALKHLPVWVFHGAQDEIVPLAESELLVGALRVAGGDVRLTVYPDAAHDSWTRTYDNPDLYAWFLQHTRSGDGLDTAGHG